MFDGDEVQGFPLLLRGLIGVSSIDPDTGRIIELYRFLPGECCAVAAARLLAPRLINAVGTALADSSIIVLSPVLFHKWLTHLPFLHFVLQGVADRFAHQLAHLNSVAFWPLDRRLALHLLTHVDEQETTHQTLAAALGTTRESITRVLNRFEAAGLVQLSRERVQIALPAALRLVARGRPPR